MNFIIWIVIGGILGWIASMIMHTNAQQGILLNVVVGIIGALLGGWLLAPLFGTGTINQNDFSLGSLVVSLLGAVILLSSSLMLATPLTPHIGYDRAAAIAKHAHQHNLSLRDAALASGYLSAQQFDQWVRPDHMLHPSPGSQSEPDLN